MPCPETGRTVGHAVITPCRRPRHREEPERGASWGPSVHRRQAGEPALGGRARSPAV